MSEVTAADSVLDVPCVFINEVGAHIRFKVLEDGWEYTAVPMKTMPGGDYLVDFNGNIVRLKLS